LFLSVRRAAKSGSPAQEVNRIGYPLCGPGHFFVGCSVAETEAQSAAGDFRG
jgi:hypothetical protein